MDTLILFDNPAPQTTNVLHRYDTHGHTPDHFVNFEIRHVYTRLTPSTLVIPPLNWRIAVYF